MFFLNFMLSTTVPPLGTIDHWSWVCWKHSENQSGRGWKALGRHPEIISESPLLKPRSHSTADQLPVQEKNYADFLSLHLKCWWVDLHTWLICIGYNVSFFHCQSLFSKQLMMVQVPYLQNFPWNIHAFPKGFCC